MSNCTKCGQKLPLFFKSRHVCPASIVGLQTRLGATHVSDSFSTRPYNVGLGAYPRTYVTTEPYQSPRRQDDDDSLLTTMVEAAVITSVVDSLFDSGSSSDSSWSDSSSSSSDWSGGGGDSGGGGASGDW